MHRLACVNVDRLPVQVIEGREGWRHHPVAWLDVESATGQILLANDRALRLGVQPGMRYTRALSLAPKLRAATLTTTDLTAQIETLAARLRDFSPGVEAADAATEPGLFWLDASGLSRLFPSLPEWARQVRETLRAEGLISSVAVGFERFATACLARQTNGVRVFAEPAEERQALAQIPLTAVIHDPRTRDLLTKLGLRRVADFDALPAATRRARFGAHGALAERARRFVADPIPEPCRAHYALTEPVTDQAAILVILDDLMPKIHDQARRQNRLIARLMVTAEWDNRTTAEMALEPATPGLDMALFRRLAELRLAGGAMALPDGVGIIAMTLNAELAVAGSRQESLFAVRDVSAADGVLAELRARFGPDAVVQARPCAEWLPGRDFTWEPMRHVDVPQPKAPSRGFCIRRLLSTPRRLAAGGPDRAPLPRLLRQHGPYRFDGAWWDGEARPYDVTHYLAECSDGQVCWVYYDHGDRAWFTMGYLD